MVVATTMRRDTVEVRSLSYPDFVDWREQNTVFERIAARTATSFTLTGGAEPERVDGELVTADYFPLLRARAAFGRTFLPEEDRAPDTHRVALVGYGLWQRRFGASPALVGQTIQLNDGNYTVVGVMPEGFRGVSDDAEIWLPMMMLSSVRPTDYLQQRDQRWLGAVARLKPGVTLAQAQTEMDAITRRLEQAYPDTNRNRGARVTPLHERFFGDLQLTLWILLGAVGCVLLVACANVANLQLQRAAGRASEIAVRLALGATPRRLIRQLLTDSLVPAVRGVLQKLDPDLPAYGVTTMAQAVANHTAQSRFSAWLLGVFGALAMALAAIGIYSVMAYAVEQRSREFGVRIALGARVGDVLKMVVGQGMRLALLGVALGLGASLALTQLMKRLLFGVGSADPMTYGAIALLLTLVAFLACYVPARRATKVDPMVALRRH